MTSNVILHDLGGQFMLFWGTVGNIVCCGPVQAERANVTELFVIINIKLI